MSEKVFPLLTRINSLQKPLCRLQVGFPAPVRVSVASALFDLPAVPPTPVSHLLFPLLGSRFPRHLCASFLLFFPSPCTHAAGMEARYLDAELIKEAEEK